MSNLTKQQIDDNSRIIFRDCNCYETGQHLFGNGVLKMPKSIKVYECKRCGRKSNYMFYFHATSKIANDWCEGKVKLISWDKAW